MQKVNLFGLDFWNASGEKEVADILVDNSQKELFVHDNIEFVITPNAFDITLFLTKNKDIYESLRHSAVILPDGMPLVWLSKFYNPSLRKRIAGSDVFPLLWNRIKTQHKKAFFILPSEKIGILLQKEYGDIQFSVPDFFDENDDQYIQQFVLSQIETIRNFRPDFIFLGLSNPKQQKIALKLHTLLSSKADFNCILVLIGASFEFYLGLKKRAPVFFQKTGTEWLYRFLHEPKRMWKRYTIGNAVFIFLAIKHLLQKRRLKTPK